MVELSVGVGEGSKMTVRFDEAVVVNNIAEEVEFIRRQRCLYGGRFDREKYLVAHTSEKNKHYDVCSLLFVANVKEIRILYSPSIAFLARLFLEKIMPTNVASKFPYWYLIISQYLHISMVCSQRSLLLQFYPSYFSLSQHHAA